MIPARGPQTVFLAIFGNLGHLVAARVELPGLVQTTDAREGPKAIFFGTVWGYLGCLGLLYRREPAILETRANASCWRGLSCCVAAGEVSPVAAREISPGGAGEFFPVAA